MHDVMYTKHGDVPVLCAMLLALSTAASAPILRLLMLAVDALKLLATIKSPNPKATLHLFVCIFTALFLRRLFLRVSLGAANNEKMSSRISVAQEHPIGVPQSIPWFHLAGNTLDNPETRAARMPS